MGFLSSVWNGAKLLLGFTGASEGADNVMKVASGVGKFIDEQNFTPEERAQYNLKLVEHYGEFMKATVGENTNRSITRRELAMFIIRVELWLLILSVILYKIDKPLAEYVFMLCTDSPLSLLTLGVGAFFFGTHLVRATKGQ